MTSRLSLLRVDGPLAARTPAGRIAVPDWGLAVAGAGLAIGGVAGAEHEPLVLALLVGAVASGILSRAGRTGRPWSWLTPSALRTLEYTLIWAVGRAAAGAAGSAAAFALIAVVAMHHYDVVYRVRTGQPGLDERVALAIGGWELRSLVLVVALPLGLQPGLLWALAGWCLLVVIVDRVRLFTSSGDRR
jgi:hypothetical protein